MKAVLRAIGCFFIFLNVSFAYCTMYHWAKDGWPQMTPDEMITSWQFWFTMLSYSQISAFLAVIGAGIMRFPEEEKTTSSSPPPKPRKRIPTPVHLATIDGKRVA